MRLPLSQSHPQLVVQWHPENAMSVESVSKGSTKRVLWICDKGHEWEARVDHRANGSNCPYCSNQRVLAGYNDLATTHPHLAEEIQGVDPTTVSAGSNKSFSWKCSQGHVWKQSAVKRSNRGDGCPYCSGRAVTPGVNDLGTTHPDVAIGWDTEKNSSFTPAEVKAKSDKQAWWKCEESHSWQRSISEQVRAEGRCPFCSGKRVVEGENDLRGLYPELYAEIVNPPAVPLYPGSGQKVEWKCSEGHTWTAQVKSRVKGSGCPYCSGRHAETGVADLATLMPSVAEEWHPTKNGDLSPYDVRISSGLKAWWLCKENHEWEAWVYARSAGSGCPKCVGGGTSKVEEEISSWLTEQEIVFTANTRKIIPPYELDIYIPSRKFAIEFNGLYWHSENMGKDKTYHLRKVELAESAGVTLFQIWEDDWRDRKEIVKRMLLHRLRLATDKPVGARKTSAVKIDKMTAQTFLNNNHIQGSSNSSEFFGLRTRQEDELVAVVGIKRTAGKFYLERYATSTSVPGGFSKLLKYAVMSSGITELITFADRSISQGDLYEKTGFYVDKILPPDYSYVVKGSRVHKFNYRLSRFRKDSTLIYQEGLTEREHAQLNGIPRIWDSGKIRYVWKAQEGKA